MIHFRTLTDSEAAQKVNYFDTMSEAEFEDQVMHWASYNVDEFGLDNSYLELRNKLVDTFKKALEESNNRVNYQLDLRIGIVLYELLNPKEGFTNVMANDDGFWRYISVCVCPDITFLRYPNRQEDVDIIKRYIPNVTYAGGITTEKDSIHIKKKRFYSHTRRIWLKTLWWYIHLSWQNDPQITYEVLKNNGTNIIGHFIERPGRGYRTGLFRSMMYAYSLLGDKGDTVFRAAAKMNRAKCLNIEPALTLGGEAEYAKALFSEVAKKADILEDEQENAENEEMKEVKNDISFLKQNGIDFVDKRPEGGALWLIGGEELEDIVNESKQFGLSFRFKEDGGKATKGLPGWWSK